MWQFNRMLKTSSTSILFKWFFNRDFQSQQNMYLLDVRIHHRICDLQNIYFTHFLNWKKRLLATINKCDNSTECWKRLKNIVYWSESSTETCSCNNKCNYCMRECITESVLFKNIYFTHLLNWTKRLLATI